MLQKPELKPCGQAPSFVFANQVMIFNVLTLTLVLAACLAHAMWLVFPRVEGNYDMSQGRRPQRIYRFAGVACGPLEA